MTDSEVITSRKNQRIASAARLRRAAERRDRGMTILEGPHVLQEALATGQAVVEVFCLPDDEATAALCRTRGIEPVAVSQDVLDRLAPTDHPRGPVALMKIPEMRSLRRDLLALEVTDPGNSGTLIRAGAAFGLDVLVAAGVDPWSPKTLRAGAGAQFRTRFEDRAEGVGSSATVVRRGIDPSRLNDVLDPSKLWAIRVGSEAHGLASETIEAADVLVTIPMPGMTESLNSSVAGSIVAYEFARWRKAQGLPPVGG